MLSARAICYERNRMNVCPNEAQNSKHPTGLPLSNSRQTRQISLPYQTQSNTRQTLSWLSVKSVKTVKTRSKPLPMDNGTAPPRLLSVNTAARSAPLVESRQNRRTRSPAARRVPRALCQMQHKFRQNTDPRSSPCSLLSPLHAPRDVTFARSRYASRHVARRADGPRCGSALLVT